MTSKESSAVRKKNSRILERQTNRIKRNYEANNTEYNEGVIQTEMIQKRLSQLVHALPISSQIKRSFDPQSHQQKMNSYVDVDQLPYQAMKRNVGWLTVAEQDANSTLSLTEELERFASYVGVSKLYLFFLLSVYDSGSCS
jgi:hypothetical protein